MKQAGPNISDIYNDSCVVNINVYIKNQSDDQTKSVKVENGSTADPVLATEHRLQLEGLTFTALNTTVTTASTFRYTSKISFLF